MNVSLSIDLLVDIFSNENIMEYATFKSWSKNYVQFRKIKIYKGSKQYTSKKEAI